MNRFIKLFCLFCSMVKVGLFNPQLGAVRYPCDCINQTFEIRMYIKFNGEDIV